MAEQTLKWWHVRWRPVARAARWLAIVAGVLCVLAAIAFGVLYLLGPWVQARHLGNFDPRLNTIPPDVPTHAQAPLSNTNYDHYGFKFQLPNREIGKIDVGETSMVMFVPNGGLLIIQNTQPFDTANLLPIVRRDKRIEQLLGQELSQSNTKLMQAALSATPEQVEWWRFRSAQNERQDILLTLKFYTFTECSSTLEPFMRTTVYTIAFGAFRGIQCGNPDVAPYDAHIDVFDKDNRHFALDIRGSTGHGQILTQEELNAMVASIRPSPQQ